MEAKAIEETQTIDCWHLCQECGREWEHEPKKYQRVIVHENFCIFRKFASCPTCLKSLAGSFLVPESPSCGSLNIEEELYDPISTELTKDSSPTIESNEGGNNSE